MRRFSAAAVFMTHIKEQYWLYLESWEQLLADLLICKYCLGAKLRHLGSRSLIVGQEMVFICHRFHSFFDLSNFAHRKLEVSQSKKITRSKERQLSWVGATTHRSWTTKCFQLPQSATTAAEKLEVNWRHKGRNPNERNAPPAEELPREICWY